MYCNQIKNNARYLTGLHCHSRHFLVIHSSTETRENMICEFNIDTLFFGFKDAWNPLTLRLEILICACFHLVFVENDQDMNRKTCITCLKQS